MKDLRRRFSRTSERVAIYFASDGRCALCGEILGPDWHADHIVPWGAGGETRISNGQALCPACNVRKGGRVSSGTEKLRKWQRRAIDVWKNHGDANFLCVATPGAGKTVFALSVMDVAARENGVERFLWITPNLNLKRQVASVAHVFGFNLDPAFMNKYSRLATDMHGAVVTYQQVANEVGVFIGMCRDRPTMVIMDEVHHIGEQRVWGDSIAQATEPCIARLLMSGTPFRSDNAKIPFVRYPKGESEADFTFGYADAIKDEAKVCRKVMFHCVDGDMKWMDNDRIVQASFGEEINDRDASRRLETALATSGGVVRTILQEAVSKLNQLRNDGHTQAKGIVFADNVTHAADCKSVLDSIEGNALTVGIATVDEPNAEKEIDSFKTDDRKWLVTIKMVGEGVDIPDARVAVHLTRVVTPLFFRQEIGRVVRYMSDLDRVGAAQDGQLGYCYFPSDERLKRNAADILTEQNHVIEEEDYDDVKNGPREHGPLPQRTWFPLGSENGRLDSVIYSGEKIEETHHLTVKARELMRSHDLSRSLHDAVLPVVLDALRLSTQNGDSEDLVGVVSHTSRDRKDALLDRNNNLVRMIARMCRAWVSSFSSPDGETVVPYQTVNYVANKHVGVKNVRVATEDQLTKRIAFLEGILQDHRG